jgi:spore maturation protein CgeB
MKTELKILFLGANSGNALKRANAMRRLGHDVTVMEPLALFPRKDFVGKVTYVTGGLFLEGFVRWRISSLIRGQHFDVIVVDCGELIGPSTLKHFRKFSQVIINYTTEDPFGQRDRNKWRLYLKSVPFYDLLVVVREINVSEAYAQGARKVMRVFMSVDELDGPRPLSAQDRQRFDHEVLFVGTWMPERGPFLSQLLNAGISLAIYGNDWQKAREWPILRASWKGPAIYGADYIKALQLAKVSLGLLSKGNRDLHTTRTFEIPYAGGLFCAERTSEHLQLYQEDVEAVFWSNVQECIDKCEELLRDEPRRRAIVENGRRRCISNGIFNGSVMANILKEAL